MWNHHQHQWVANLWPTIYTTLQYCCEPCYDHICFHLWPASHKEKKTRLCLLRCSSRGSHPCACTRNRSTNSLQDIKRVYVFYNFFITSVDWICFLLLGYHNERRQKLSQDHCNWHIPFSYLSFVDIDDGAKILYLI